MCNDDRDPHRSIDQGLCGWLTFRVYRENESLLIVTMPSRHHVVYMHTRVTMYAYACMFIRTIRKSVIEKIRSHIIDHVLGGGSVVVLDTHEIWYDMSGVNRRYCRRQEPVVTYSMVYTQPSNDRPIILFVIEHTIHRTSTYWEIHNFNCWDLWNVKQPTILMSILDKSWRCTSFLLSV